MDDPTGVAASLEDGARFVSVDPTKNRSRFYELRWRPTLWGGLALVRTWGRLGTPGRSVVSLYPDRAAARPAIERAIRRRLRHEYRLVAAR